MTEEKITTLLELFKEIPEIYDYSIYSNKNVFMSDFDIRKLKDSKGYELNYLINNPNFTFDIILENLDLNWDWDIISTQFGNNYIHLYSQLPWVYKNIYSPNEQYLKDNLDKDWDWDNMNISIEFILSYKNLFKNYDEIISRNSKLTITQINNYPEIEWDWWIISENINVEEIANHPEQKWDWDLISMNNTLTTDFIIKNINTINAIFVLDTYLYNEKVRKNIDLSKLLIYQKFADALVKHRATLKLLIFLTFDTIPEKYKSDDNLDKYFYLSFVKGLSIDYIINNKDKDWNWEALSKNSSFTIGDIEKGLSLGLPFEIVYVGYNPNCTYEFIFTYKKEFIKYFYENIGYDLNEGKNLTSLYDDWIYSNPFNPEYKRRQLKNSTQLLQHTNLIKDLNDIIIEY
jgi:hypothetical protein